MIYIIIYDIIYISEKIISLRSKICMEVQQKMGTIFYLFSYSLIFTIREIETFSYGSKQSLQGYLKNNCSLLEDVLVNFGLC